MTPLKKWCEQNHISITNAYRLMNKGVLTANKIGRLTFLSDDADRAFRESLPKYKPQNGGQE
jgi:predicted site-specific integrase-resolvase